MTSSCLTWFGNSRIPNLTFNGSHLPFWNIFIHLFKWMKHWNIDIIGYWVNGAGCSIEKDLEHNPSPPNCSKDSWKLFITTNWLSLMTQWVVVHPVSCTNTHHDVTDLVNHGMVKNAKALLFWERNKTFPRNKKILNPCLIWQILRSYHSEAEVTF